MFISGKVRCHKIFIKRPLVTCNCSGDELFDLVNPPYKKRWRYVDLKNIFPQILIGCKNIKTIFNESYKFNQICLLSHEIFCWQSNVFCQNYEVFNWRYRHVDVFQITKVFVFAYNNKALYRVKRQPIFNKLILQDVFNCHYMQPTQIRIELLLRSTCRHLFYYGGLHRTYLFVPE